MSMKIFTLSAVTVLVYGLMIALSGTSNFPSYSERRTPPAEEEGNQRFAALWDGSLSSGDPPVQDWDGPRDKSEAPGSYKGTESQAQNRPVRWIGIMFILVWIFVSVRLLSTD